MEIELKYGTDRETGMNILKELSERNGGRIAEIPMLAVYYDTVDKSLSARHITYRLRREGEDCVLTVKYGRGSDKPKGALHKREEVNVSVGYDFFEKPGIDVLWDTPVYKELDGAVGGQYSDALGLMLPVKPLKPVMEMRFTRFETEISLGGSGEGRAVLSYDGGKIIADNKRENISELEIELTEGNEEELLAFGDEISRKYGLRDGLKSKFARGLKLLDR